MSSWSGTVIWWQVYPFGFLDAEKQALPAGSTVQHRLPALNGWLDYLVELGCNGLALNPVFSSESHGYDIVDHFAIDPRLGDEADIDTVIAQCHSRGIRVLFDGVFNHVGRSFPGFADVLANREQSSWAGWFDIDWAADGHDGFGYRNFEGHGSLVALNHETPAVADYVVAVMDHWLDRGIDGWRLDAAYAVPLDFWRTVTDRVRVRHPDAWFVGEVIHGDFPDWVRQGGLDSVTQYELWKSIWSSLNDGNFWELAWTLDRHAAFVKDFVPLTFVGNHDVTRIASQLTDPRHLAHALVVLFTMPGVPSVYYGDEQGFTGVKEDREGGDDAVRPSFPTGPEQLAPDGWPVYRLHQQLIGLRRRESWLTDAQIEVVSKANEQLQVRAAGTEGQQLLVLLNIADDEFEFTEVGPFEVLLRSDDGASGGAGPAVTVAGHGWVIARPAS
ncbi:MAG TPA: alpha-amylase family glycosyl hydrolase [Mycobacterium sp.]